MAQTSLGRGWSTFVGSCRVDDPVPSTGAGTALLNEPIAIIDHSQVSRVNELFSLNQIDLVGNDSFD